MQTEPESPIRVFVTLDQALGQLRLDPGREEQPVVGVDIHPSAATAATRLADRGYAVDVLVPGEDAFEVASALAGWLPATARARPAAAFTASLMGDDGEPDGPSPPDIFVAADRVRRGVAERRGLVALPHLALADALLRGESLSFARIVGSRPQLGELPEFLPYHLERRSDGQWSCLGVVTRGTLVSAVLRRLQVVVLPLNIGVDDPLFVQLDDADETAVEAFASLRVLAADGQRMLVALGPDQSTDDIAFHGAHGHFEHLAPSPDLLEPAPDAAAAAVWAAGFAAAAGVTVVTLDPPSPRLAAAGDEAAPCPATAASFAADVDRFSGASDPGGGPIVSRHADHPHNPRAVDLLLTELRDLGYCAITHPFAYGGGLLDNVIADLPGRGIVRLEPDVREQVRERLLATPMPRDGGDDPTGLTAVAGLAEAAALLGLDAHASSGADDRWRRRGAVEQAAGLSPWQTWWLSDCPLPGAGAELVLVGCHLDSTAQADTGFASATDPSPGADDNASGVAGVLALARSLAPLQGTLTHTVRFCFFNAEERGLVGSKAYANAMKAAGAPIRAVVCMDMIGFNNDDNRLFEIHAGFTDPAVRDRSDPIAQRVAAAALSLGALAPAQVYRGTLRGSPTDRDRDQFDGAIGRSDHAAFHEQGYPAVVVTEDLFVNRSAEPGFDPNPNYHSGRDTVIDAAFAADIVCAVARVVRELAS